MSSNVVDLVDDTNDLDTSDSLLLFQTVTILQESKKTEKKITSKKSTTIKESFSKESVVSNISTTDSAPSNLSTAPTKLRTRRATTATINKLVREVNSLLPQDREIVLNMLNQTNNDSEENSNLNITKSEEPNNNNNNTANISGEISSMINPLIKNSSVANSIQNSNEKVLFSLRLELGNLLGEQAEMRNKEKKLRAQIKKVQKTVAAMNEETNNIFDNFIKPVEEVIMKIFPFNPSFPSALHPLALLGSKEDLEKCENDPIIQENIAQSSKISMSCPLWSCCTFNLHDDQTNNFDIYANNRRVDPDRDAVIIDSKFDSEYANSQSTVIRSQSSTNISLTNTVDIGNVSQLFSQTNSSFFEESKENEFHKEYHNENEINYLSNHSQLKENFKLFTKKLLESGINELIDFVSIDYSISSLISLYDNFLNEEKYKEDCQENLYKILYFFIFLVMDKFKVIFYSPRNPSISEYKKLNEELFSLFFSVYQVINLIKPHVKINLDSSHINSIFSASQSVVSFYESPQQNASASENQNQLKDVEVTPLTKSQIIDLISPGSIQKTGESIDGVNISKIQKVLDLFAYNDNLESLDISKNILTEEKMLDKNKDDSVGVLLDSVESTENNDTSISNSSLIFEFENKQENLVKDDLKVSDIEKMITENSLQFMDKEQVVIEPEDEDGVKNGEDEEDEAEEQEEDNDDVNEIDDEVDYFYSDDDIDEDKDDYDELYEKLSYFNSEEGNTVRINLESATSGMKTLTIEALRGFLINSKEFYNNILTFQPLNLDLLYDRLKKEDFKLPQKLKLLPLLDKLEVFVSVQRIKKAGEKRKKTLRRPSKKLKLN